MKLSLRRRLLTVSALAAVACAGALFAVLPLVRTSQDQRLERARDLAERTFERARDRTGDRARGTGASDRDWPRERDGDRDGAGARREDRQPPPPLSPFDPPTGARRSAGRKLWSGRLDARGRVDATSRAPAPVRNEIERLARSLSGRAAETHELDVDDGVVAIALGRAEDGGIAYGAVMLTEPAETMRWRIGVLVLAAATLALVIASLQALVAIGRGSRSLSSSLSALATDLRAPVTRPSVQELATVGDGIADLAERLRRARDEETRLNAELVRQEHLASLGRVAAGVAHEVRNPLAAIKLRVDLLKLGGVSPQVARDLGDVADEVSRLDRLVADLLVVTGRRVEQREATDLGALVRDRVELLRPWSEQREIDLETKGETRADVNVDSITRVIDNLVRNAVEAAPKGTSVRVEASTDDGASTIAVVDRGPGIEPAKVAQVFEPFFTTKPDGTGLGLAICRSIAAAHDGELRYRRVGDETRFELRLPASAVG